MADKIDFTKADKELYQPPKKPVVVTVPPISYAYVDGKGAPEGRDYQNGVGALYSMSNTIKFSQKSGNAPAGFFDYVVAPLEGLWAKVPTLQPGDRDTWRFTSLIRQPDFVTPEVFQWAIGVAKAKKPDIDFSPLHLATWEEGLCVQCLHIGPFATEPETLALMEAFMAENGYEMDFDRAEKGLRRSHHEIYLKDMLKTQPGNMKTVLRYPVKRAK